MNGVGRVGGEEEAPKDFTEKDTVSRPEYNVRSVMSWRKELFFSRIVFSLIINFFQSLVVQYFMVFNLLQLHFFSVLV